MKGTHILRATTDGFIPELIIDSQDIIKAGFTPGAAFKIEPYQDGLVITLISDEGEIERLLFEVDAHPILVRTGYGITVSCIWQETG